MHIPKSRVVSPPPQKKWTFASPRDKVSMKKRLDLYHGATDEIFRNSGNNDGSIDNSDATTIKCFPGSVLATSQNDTSAPTPGFRIKLTYDVEFKFRKCDIVFSTKPKIKNIRAEGGIELNLPGIPTIRGTAGYVKTIKQSTASSLKATLLLFGRPHNLAELAFQAVRPRTSKNIWHEVELSINLRLRDRLPPCTIVNRNIKFNTVSKFPSHSAWENGIETIWHGQNRVADLWLAAPASTGPNGNEYVTGEVGAAPTPPMGPPDFPMFPDARNTHQR